MNTLTELPPWAWVTVMLLTDVVAVSLLMSHEQKQNRKLLRAEKKRLEEWAEARAEQLADERFREMQLAEKMQRLRR